MVSIEANYVVAIFCFSDAVGADSCIVADSMHGNVAEAGEFLAAFTDAFGCH